MRWTKRVSLLRQNLRGTKGMTLIEIMMGFAILAVLMVLSLSLMLFSSNAFNTEGDRDRLKMTGDEVYSYVNRRLTFATHIQILPAGTSPDSDKVLYDNILYVKDGRLYGGVKGGPYSLVFADSVYQDAGLALTAYPRADAVLGIQVGLTRKNATKPAYSVNSAFRILNMYSAPKPDDETGGRVPTEPEEGGSKIEWTGLDGTAAAKNPVISYDGAAFDWDGTYTGGPYTVIRHPRDSAVSYQENTDYTAGTIVEWNGEYFRLNRDMPASTDPQWRPGSSMTHFWTNLSQEDIDDASPGGSAKSLYSMYDVIVCDGKYYMCHSTIDTAHKPPQWDIWVQVYWFQDKATAEDPMLGWSLDPAILSYKSVYDKYPKS